MKDSQLLELLGTLDPQERAEFRLFVQSPYFNRGNFAADMLPLLDVLLERLVQAAPVFEKENIHRAAFAGQLWVEGKMEKRMSKLLGLLRQFLVARRELKAEDESEYQLALAEVYQERKLLHRVGLLLPRIEAQIGAITAQNHRFFELQFRLAQAAFEYQQVNSIGEDLLSAGNLLHRLWLFYQIWRLETLNGIRNLRVIELDQQFPDIIVQQMADEPPLPADITEQYPVLGLYDAINNTLKKEKITLPAIKLLQERLERYEQAIHIDIRKAAAALLRNLCVVHYEKGEFKAVPFLFHLYREHLKAGYLYQYDGKMTPTGFQAIVNIALIMNELAWLRQFLTEHDNKILGDKDTRECVRLAWAKLLAHEGRWQEAYDILPDHVRHTALQFMHNRLELMILYELKSPLLESRMDALKVYLSRFRSQTRSRQTLATLQKAFLNILYQITRARPGDQTRAEKIRTQIDDLRFFWGKNWLLEKAEVLAGKK